MKKEDINLIREFALDRLNNLKDNSFPKETEVMEKILVMTTECLKI